MITILRIIGCFFIGVGISGSFHTIANENHIDDPAPTAGSCPHWMNHSLKQLHKNAQVNLCDLAAKKAVLIVNTASHCGFTGQFKGLEKLHQTYQEKGLVVIGFPSNDFNQEADSAKETANVCYLNYGVSFFMSEKVHVRGASAHPIFQHLIKHQGAPRWNFNKYLIDSDGKIVEKFASNVRPESKILVSAIEQVLK